MSALIAPDPHPDVSERHRRQLLAESDALLGQVEQLRLAEQRACPPLLGEAVRALQLRLGRAETNRPRTIGAAQNLVFAIQARLMAANPRNVQPAPQPGRPQGVPRVAVLRPAGAAWKFLALPPPPASADAPAVGEWLHLVQLTVVRALDRWVCAQDQAVAAARARQGALRAVHLARAAWRNYWELRCEAEGLLSRISPATRVSQSRPPAAPAARPP